MFYYTIYNKDAFGKRAKYVYNVIKSMNMRENFMIFDKKWVKEHVFEIVEAASKEDAAVSIDYIVSEMVTRYGKEYGWDCGLKIISEVIADFEESNTFESQEIFTSDGISKMFWL